AVGVLQDHCEHRATGMRLQVLCRLKTVWQGRSADGSILATPTGRGGTGCCCVPGTCGVSPDLCFPEFIGQRKCYFRGSHWLIPASPRMAMEKGAADVLTLCQFGTTQRVYRVRTSGLERNSGLKRRMCWAHE